MSLDELDTGAIDGIDRQPEFITIGVHVSPDRMQAHFTLEPVAGARGTLTAEHLISALEEAEVVRGFNKALLKNIAGDWSAEPRSMATAPVAKGKPAVDEKVGALTMLVRHLTVPNEIKAALESKFFWEVAGLAHKFQRVDHGTIIARRAKSTTSLLGYDVFGTAIQPAEPETGPLDEGTILELNNVFMAGYTYTAAKTGIVYVDEDNLPKVIPLEFNGTVELRVAPDMMSAELTALPAGERGTMPTVGFIRNFLKSKNIAYGVDENELAFLMGQISKGISAPMTVIVAEGQRAMKGDDGRVEFCFNTDSSPMPSINPDGSVDYKSVNIVTTVQAGAILAKLHPPSMGRPGMDLAGRAAKALDGAAAAMPAGAGTIVSPTDPNTLTALIDGVAKFDGTAVNVTEGYVISSDIDHSTGNVNHQGSVVINGDVKSGFEVNCVGDLQVNGMVEDCKIAVKGNVLCRYGFTGKGGGVIVTGGDVNLGYIKNQMLITDGNVNIAKDAINSNITARKSIRIYGHTLSAVGGTLITTESIVLKTVGTVSGAITTLQIDPEPELVTELAQMEAAAEGHAANIQKIEKTLKNTAVDKPTANKLKDTIIQLHQQRDAVKLKMREINVAINKFENSFIRIDRLAYPGTIIKIGPYTKALSSPLAGGKTIRVIDGEIRIL
ncbi:MAG: FapA family protein [Chitinispirillales bacterium]|jgi:uncharacterized protein (DUF342 family)|nr:FapA family protein [Chitinispirillales bacterium]